MDLSPEERQKRSDRAKAQIAAGTFGGKQPGSGRPRNKRASEVIAERAREKAGLIADALFDSLEPGNHPSIRMQAARDLLSVEAREVDLARIEAERLDNLSKDALIERLAPALVQLIAKGVLDPRTLGSEVIEGTASEVRELGSHAA